jgi:dihydrofolate reductase
MISIIVAMDKNRLIGGENKLLWNIPSELKRFKEITTGHPIIMGRKTHQSIGRVLPNRTNIIITRDQDYKVEGTIIVHSLEEALNKAQSEPGSDEIFVIGGGQIYAQALPLADRLYLTIVEGDYKGDTYFPDYSAFDKVVEEKYFNEAGIKYKTLILEK